VILRPPSLRACGLAVLLTVAAACQRGVAAPAARLVRGPYLQLLTTHSVMVVWKTDLHARCSLALRPRAGVARTIDAGTGRTCAVRADGLGPGRSYGYVPHADGVPLADEAVFRTDDPGAPFAFLVLGDSGSGDADQRAVRDRMLATPADFILHTGDMVYPRGEASRFDAAVFEPYAALLRSRVLWPCLGNHDVRTARGAPWRAAFHTPANNPQRDEAYYSFHRGNALFVVLDSNAPTAPASPQHQFLEGVLTRDIAPWKFVVLHHSLYSSGRHGSRAQVRDDLVPLFDRHHVDVVFMGHEHDYERTHPLRAGAPVARGAGTVYVTTGGGGQALRPVGRSAFTAHAEATLHFVRVAVDGPTLRLEMIRADGTVGDAMRLVKPEGSGPRASAPGS
jgi:predicted phosphodiesterase